MTDIDVAALRAAAEGATPGPWEWDGAWGVNKRERPTSVVGVVYEADEEDAAYIAAANPAVVLELLDRLAAAEGAVARVRAVAGSHDFVESVVRKTCAVGPNEEPHHTCRLAGEAAALAMALVVNVGLQDPQIETEDRERP